MNPFKSKGNITTVAERPSVIVEIKFIDKEGHPIDPSAVWLALLEAFKLHSKYEIKSAKVSPDKHE